MKNNKLKLQYSLLALTIANFITILICFFLLGDSVPIHFNINMEVDMMGAPWLVLVLAGVPVLCALSLFIELKIRGEDYKNKKILKILMFSLCCLFFYLNWLFFAVCASGLQMGEKLKISFDLLIGIPMGIIFIILGNYMPIVKRNKTMGLRTKSSLYNDEIWAKSNRLGGLLIVIGGLIVIAFTLIGWGTKINWMFFIGLGLALILMTIPTVIYAKVLYNKQKKFESTEIETNSEN